MSWANAFKDAKGDWNLAETLGAPTFAVAVGTWVWKAWHLPGLPDIQSLAIGAATFMAGLGAAQRLRGDADIDREHHEGDHS
jgi:hypothetical protein